MVAGVNGESTWRVREYFKSGASAHLATSLSSPAPRARASSSARTAAAALCCASPAALRAVSSSWLRTGRQTHAALEHVRMPYALEWPTQQGGYR